MNIKVAMRLLDLTMDSLNEENLRSSYRNKMKTAHPDAGGDEETAKNINLAYSLLINNLDKINERFAVSRSGSKEKDKTSVLITLAELIKIYRGNTIECKDIKGKKDVYLNKLSLYKYKIYIEVKAVVNGRIIEEYILYDREDEYELFIGIKGMVEKELEIKIEDKIINLKITSNNMVYIVKFDYNIRVYLRFIA